MPVVRTAELTQQPSMTKAPTCRRKGVNCKRVTEECNNARRESELHCSRHNKRSSGRSSWSTEYHVLRFGRISPDVNENKCLSCGLGQVRQTIKNGTLCNYKSTAR